MAEPALHPTPLKRCVRCSAAFTRQPWEREFNFRRRRFCSPACSYRYRSALGVAARLEKLDHQEENGATSWRERYPGASLCRIKEAPTACSCGGLMYPVPEGVTCLLCGNLVVIAECLYLLGLHPPEDVLEEQGPVA